MQSSRDVNRRWYWLLIVPLASMLYPPLYAKATPALWGLPFFYWFQFAIIALTAAVIGLVYLVTRRDRGGG